MSKVITPDIIVNPHFASLEMMFYEGPNGSKGGAFPSEYQGDGFACEHGSGTAPSAPATKSFACP